MINFNSIGFATETIQLVAEKLGNILRAGDANRRKLSNLRNACRRYGIGVAGISQDGKNADLIFCCRGIEGKANIKLENPGIMITLEIEEEMYK